MGAVCMCGRAAYFCGPDRGEHGYLGSYCEEHAPAGAILFRPLPTCEINGCAKPAYHYRGNKSLNVDMYRNRFVVVCDEHRRGGDIRFRQEKKKADEP